MRLHIHIGVKVLVNIWTDIRSLTYYILKRKILSRLRVTPLNVVGFAPDGRRFRWEFKNVRYVNV